MPNKISDLVSFLQDNSIPKTQKVSKTFLDITKLSSHENINSLIYAFFFNAEEEHGFGNLFLNSLVELILQKGSFGDTISTQDYFSVKTEKSTKRKGRIDIVLESQDVAILIENKIYHVLNNDLCDYWSSIKKDKKYGVVLSLHPINIHNSNFISITHLDFLQLVKEKLVIRTFKGGVNEKYLTLFNEFYDTIKKLTKPMHQEEIDFYYSHLEKIEAISNLNLKIREGIEKEVEKLDSIYQSDFKLGGRANVQNIKKRLRYLTSRQFPDLMYTIIYDGLFTDKKELQIIIEVRDGLFHNRTVFKDVIFNEIILRNKENPILNDDFFDNHDDHLRNWKHFAHKRYDGLSNQQITQLTQFITTEIDTHFKPIMDELLNFLKKNRF